MVRWIGVSHRVESTLCYWTLSEKGNFLFQTTVQHLTPEEPRDPDVQERICYYYGSLEDALRSEEFGTSLDGYDSFMNGDEEGIFKGVPNKEGFQGPPDSTDINEIIDNSGEERAANSYDQYIGDELVLPYRNGGKIIGKVRKRVRYDETSTSKGNYNTMHDKYLYEVEYPNGRTEQLAANIMDVILMSQVDSEVHHYQVLTEVTDQKKDDNAIAKVGGFIKSSSGNLHQKRTTPVWKLLVEWKDGSVDWVPLKDLKQSSPVDLAEYAVAD